MKIKIKDIVQMASALLAITYHEGCTYGEDEAVELAEKIVHETSDRYEQGWQEALEAVLACGMENEYNDLVVYEDRIRALMLSHNSASVNLEREVEILTH